MIDAHAHLHFESLVDILSDVVKRFREAGGKYILNNSVDIKTSNVVLAQAAEHEEVLASIGIHPELFIPGSDLYLRGLDEVWIDEQLSEFKKLLDIHQEVAAIGECGLDYYWVQKNDVGDEDEVYNLQTYLLKNLAEIATEQELPLVVHCRDVDGSDECVNDALKIVDGAKCLFHSYTGPISGLEKILSKDYDVSFNAIVTFANADNVRELLDMTPVSQLLIETDAPLLVPQKLRSSGIKLGEPVHVQEVAEYIADRKEMTVDELWEQVVKNFEKLFLSEA